MTQLEIAQLLKISPATVSMALHGTGRISEELREKILALTREHHVSIRKRYARKDASGAPVKRSTLRLGYCCVYHDIDAWLHAGAYRGMLEPSDATEHEIRLFSSHLSYSNSPEEIRQDFARLKERVVAARLDGLLLDPHQAFIQEVLNLPIPKVMLGYYNFFPESLDAVVCDNYAAAYKLTQKLIEQGRRRIALLRCDPETPNSREKLSGYMAALRENGITLQSQWIVESGYQREYGERAAEHLLSLNQPPDAVVLDNDWMTGHLVNALRARGRAGHKYLDSLALAHCEDARKDTGLEREIQRTEIRPDLLGRVALRHLLDRVAGRVAGEPVTIKITPFYRSGGAERIKS